MHKSLNGTWELQGFEPGYDMPSVSINAEVPGNVELDLHRAGIEPEPFFGENEYAFHKYETWSWRFSREFILDETAGSRCELVFEGLNCIADIYLDGDRLGHFENALIPHVLVLTGSRCAAGRHRIEVHIHSAVLWAREKDFPVNVSVSYIGYEYTRLRMPPHSFGWDIMPRFLSAGIWRDVYIRSVPSARITQTYLAAQRADADSSTLIYKYRFEAADPDLSHYRLRVSLDDRVCLELKPYFTAGEQRFDFAHPRLWWPRGYGEPETYILKTELIKDGVVLDTRTETVGIRVIQIDHRMEPGDEGEFLVRVNGTPILIKGSNWVPLDAFHSRDPLRLQKALELFEECGCNALRLWGGNVYETKDLFEFCDRHGILVWHDFAMGCAVYPQDEEMRAALYEEAVTVIRMHRNHPCILLWAGDNEVDEAYQWKGYGPLSNRYNALTREILPRAVRENDPLRMFLPSSPFLTGDMRREDAPEQHCWGPRAYYKDDYYRLTKAHFISECGYHGCPCVSSLRSFIPENELSVDMSGGAWTAHNSDYALLTQRGYDRNLLMRDQVELMFGSVPEDLDEFVFLSQFAQAEAMKFFVEQTRLKKWRRTGIIWWNMLDGWPQISDAVVDWYFEKKRAFHAIRRVQQPISVIADEVNGWHQDFYLCNDSRLDACVHVRIYDADTGEVILETDAHSPANQNVLLGSVRTMVSRKRLLLLEWTADGMLYKNHYLCGYPAFSPSDAKRWAALIDAE